jgi:hypothetical protein
VPWPATGELDRLLAAEAARLAPALGLAVTGLRHVLAEQARPFLELAREIEWAGGSGRLAVLGAEVKGEAAVEDGSGHARRLQFRADRLDLVGETLRFTDYKAGALPDDAVREDTRHRHLLEAVGRGERLQVAAYVASVPKASVEGRYVYLKPLERRSGARVATVQGDDEVAASHFQQAVRALIGLWDEGAFFPRLLGADGRSQGEACGRCEVKQACLQPDSGARRRLARWTEARQGAGAQAGMSLAPLEAALLSAWLLNRKPARAAGAEEAN